MPPALTRAASTGVDAYALFRAIDIDDSSAVPVEELLLCGAALGAHWADWAPSAVDELLGRGSFYKGMPLSLTEFNAFCDAVKISDLDQKRVAEFVAAGNARRAAADPFDAARIARAFKAIDLDDSGQIDLDELVHFGQAVGQGWTRAACESLLGKMDADKDSKISFAEFDAFIRNVGLHGAAEVAAFVRAGEARRNLAEPYSEATVRRAFKAIDLDDSGQIDLDELLAFGQAVGQEWTRAACQSLLGKMDKDGDQLVSFSEFDGFLREVGLHGDKGAVAAFLEAGEERRRSVGAADEEDETGASQEV